MHAYAIVLAKVGTFYYFKCIEFLFNEIQSARGFKKKYKTNSECSLRYT